MLSSFQCSVASLSFRLGSFYIFSYHSVLGLVVFDRFDVFLCFHCLLLLVLFHIFFFDA